VEVGEEGVQPAGSIGGLVRSFVASKGFGFVDGDDGESYFAHVSEVAGGEPLVTGQRITFVPTPSRKGSKATKIIPGHAPTAIYVEPTEFIVTNADIPLDVDVILVVREGWVESNDPNTARQGLIDMAKTWGANAIINSRMDRYTAQKSCSNYKYTMHRASGRFAVVKAISYSSDPIVIADAEARMQALQDWWNDQNAPSQESEAREPSTSTQLVTPAQVKFVALMVWSWTCTIGRILYLTGLYFAKKAASWYKNWKNAT
jgi:cold shock CspA family protein